jgi:hypothetical protein
MTTKKKYTENSADRFNKWLAQRFGSDEKKLVGYEVMLQVETYVKAHCPDIKVVPCDDDIFASSILLLIPQPGFGITVRFIPQCTPNQNSFFLYPSHYKKLTKALEEMAHVYEKK